MASRIKTLSPLIPTIDTRTCPLPPKEVDPFYLSSDYQRWREIVIARAGRRCEALVNNGSRCTKAEPGHRLFADHKIERRDQGADLDPANGQCLCGQHHTLKTARERSLRART